MSDKCRSETFRARKAKFEELEDKLYKWLETCRRVNLPVPPQMLRMKALKIAEQSEIPTSEFCASNGWLRNFKRRHCLSSMNLFGEGGEVDKSNPVLLENIERLKAEIDKFDTENIYNMDETGLFYRVLPRTTWITDDIDRSSVRGKKVPKDRVTLTVCCNATGSHKIPIQMIGKARKPACIVGREWPVKYDYQNNAWMDKKTFLHWFNTIFVPSVQVQTRRPVLLLLDNAPTSTVKFLTAKTLSSATSHQESPPGSSPWIRASSLL